MCGQEGALRLPTKLERIRCAILLPGYAYDRHRVGKGSRLEGRECVPGLQNVTPNHAITSNEKKKHGKQQKKSENSGIGHPQVSPGRRFLTFPRFVCSKSKQIGAQNRDESSTPNDQAFKEHYCSKEISVQESFTLVACLPAHILSYCAFEV